MIQPNELRIGNYTEYNIIDENRDEWIFNKIDISDLADTSNLRPILLTKEWLVKLGFENNIIKLNSITFLKLGKETHYQREVYVENTRGLSIGLSSKVNFVHELQNLYFSLTNQELTIK